MLQLLDSLGRVLATSGEADLYDLKEVGGDDAKKVYAKPKNGDPVTAYVKVEDLPTHETIYIPPFFAGLDSVAVPTRLRYQLFTITKVSEQDDYVEVVATHIFYEQINNFTMWEPETLVNYSCGAICRNILQNQIGNDGGFRAATDCTDELPWHQIDYARKNIVEAFLNPEDGICKRFNLSMIRDNMDFYVLKNVGYDRGMVIEDGLNLLGIEREENIENVITRVAAYGRDSDGDLVWLNNNGNRYVDSTHINDYARPRVELYDTGIQITGQKEAEELHEQGRDNEIVTADNINAKILAKAQERFTNDEVDVPEVTMNIDFVSLGDTEEYKQYRDLDKVFLYDIIHVKNKKRGYNYSAQVIGVEHDVLTGALLSVTIGNLTTWDGVRKVANWQVPEIDGSIIRMHSITASQYDYGSVTGSAIRDEAISGNHINVPSVSQALNVDQLKSILAQAGLVLDDDGILIYKNTDDNMLGTRLEVQGRRIGMVIGSNASGDFIKAGEIALAFNDADEAVAHINADHVNISATSTLHTLAGAIEEDDQGNVTITSAGGMRVRKTVSGQVAEFGVFDENSLTAGVIVDRVNGGSVTIKGSKVWVGDAASDQTLKKWATESDGLFAQNIGALSARIGTIEADYIATDNLSSEISNLASVRVNIIAGSTASFTTGSFGDVGTDTLTVPNGGLTLGSTALSTTNLVKSVEGSPVTGGGYKLTVTQVNGYSHDITFNTASSITFSGAWAGASYTATAKDPDDNVLGSVTTAISKRWSGSDLLVESGNDTLLTESMSAHVGTGNLTTGGLRTIDTFNSSHKAYGYVIGNSMSYPLFTFNVDASGEYTAGRTAGAASVTVSATGWQGGSNVVSASNGESVTISMPAVTMSSGNWASHKKTVYAYSSEAGISGYIASHEVDATTEYNSGVTAGNTAAGVTSSWSGNTFTVTRAANTSTKSLSCIVTITPNSAKTLGYGESVTVKALGNASEKASVTITAPADRYQDGYNAGWAAARAKISRSGAKIMVPPATVDGAAVEGYNITVVQGGISASRITSSNYALSASSSAYINGTAVATDSTSRNLSV